MSYSGKYSYNKKSNDQEILKFLKNKSHMPILYLVGINYLTTNIKINLKTKSHMPDSTLVTLVTLS